jgi:dTDP-4-dehydrorhamnose reductase
MSATSNILITGASGQLGSEFKHFSVHYPTLHFRYSDAHDLDITNEQAIEDTLAAGSYQYLINCAAYTAVDKAETDQELAHKINGTASGLLAAACARHGVKYIHISTDFVFDGTNHRPYQEIDAVAPLGVYGASKLQGEQLALEANPNSLVFRTSWLYSTYGNNFVKTMRRLGADKPSLNVIFDQVGTPTYARDLAKAILESIVSGKAHTFAGLYHFSNEGAASWYDFAAAVMELSGLDCKVNPINTFEYPTPAKRPHYSVLDKRKFKETFGASIPNWRESLHACINTLDMKYIVDEELLVDIASRAGEAIMEIYVQDFEVVTKEDKSPLTEADQNANEIIVKALKEHYPHIPIISEENKMVPYEVRKQWDAFWLVDPLDGTKEFIKKNGEFTVNIALIEHGKPTFGVVHVPATGVSYYGGHEKGSYCVQRGKEAQKMEHNLIPYADKAHVVVVASRSHLTQETEDFVADLKAKGKTVDYLSSGSSLKFCLVAEGKADVYPRFGPTMEWDTAAAHAVALGAGRQVFKANTAEPLTYNKENLLNPYFVVC